MKKVIMLKGLPASGKSTLANEMCKNKLVARVNRDLLREMFNFGIYSGENEKLVVEMEKTLVRNMLSRGLEHIIVDDCNLNPSNEDMWRSVADECKAEFEVIEVDTPMEECIERDKERVKSVGVDVIRNMALQYGRTSIDEPVVICDIDGTIADIEHRRHYVRGEVKDWKGFFSEMDKDTVREDVYTILKKKEEEGNKIIFVSARPEDYKDVTTKWLLDNVPLKSELMLFMRRSGDTRDDTIVKEQIYNTYLKSMNISLVIDDRPKIIRMWESLSLNVLDVGSGVEF